MRQIAIVGGGKSWIRAPFADPFWTVWAHASCFEGMQPHAVDAWVDPHTPEVRARVKPWGARYQAWLTDPAEGRTAPVYVLEDTPPQSPPQPRLTRATIFDHQVIPEAAIQAWLVARGGTVQPYVTSTGMWMFQLALFMGAETIGIWGIDYEEHAEYLVQRPCTEYWIGFARALGVKVYVTPTSPLGRDDHLYGHDGDRPDLVHTHQPYRRGKAQRVTLLQATGQEPMHEIPAEIHALIEEERARFGIDTAAEWAKAAGFR